MKIEELAEDFQESVNVSSPDQPIPGPDLLTQALNAFADSASTQDGGPAPNLPPAMAAARNKSGAEILAELNKSPLFMTDLEENDDVEALKALAYEGTPLEVAVGFKERGNESFKEKRWADAKEFYTKGITVLLAEVRKRQRGELEKGEDDAEQVKVLEQSLVNRAACHLELKNYRSCTLDCGSALRINLNNVKALYRSGKALLALGRIEEADDACARGLALDAENVALKALARDIVKKSAEIQARKKRDLEREQRRLKEVYTLKAALKARNIKTRKTPQPPEMEDAQISLVPDPVDPTSTLQFPTILLYPLHLESDFIKAFNELDSIGQHLDYILPLPWDREGVYRPANVECYMETTSGGLIKVGKKVNLLKILGTPSIEVVDEVVRIFVLPKQSAEAWIADFKKKKAAEKAEST
ncbi:TPR repeat protein [Coleophoma cylindrospora]|uniref:TPR repeat protein n=1 Tax=Coleophoma cylindrospora TaxID=1849047 RepID=A0A3D8RZP1_9HELO|nr:TPR repeat protein [Coleophoma cylindrospora]